MKKIFTHSALIVAVLAVTALVANAQNANSTAKQETTQQVAPAPAEAFFGVESLDNARNKVEEAYVKYQNAPADKAEALGAEFRNLRRLYLVELDRQNANYPSTTPTGAKIHSEMLKTYKDLR
jgi:ABC-type transporter MlaC component